MKILIAVALAGLMTGCAVPQEVFTGTAECSYIGCDTGGLIVYPHK